MSYPKEFKQYGFRVGEDRYKFEHDERQMFVLREDVSNNKTISEPADSILLPWAAWVDLAKMILANEEARLAAIPSAADLFEACFKARGIEKKWEAFRALQAVNPLAAVSAGLDAYKAKGNADRLDLIAELLHVHGDRAASAWKWLAETPGPFEHFLGALEAAAWMDRARKDHLLQTAHATNEDRHTRTRIEEERGQLHENDGPGAFWATWVNDEGRTCTVGGSAENMDAAPDALLIEAFRGHVPNIPSGRVSIRRGQTYDATTPAVEYEIKHVRERILARRV